MGRINEIKAALDALYQEYKKNKNTLNGEKTKQTAKLIAEMILSADGTPGDAAAELARFSAEVCAAVFDNLAKTKAAPLSALEDVLQALRATDRDAKLSQYYVSKFAAAIAAMLRGYPEEALRSQLLPQLVEFMARFAVKSEKNENKFYHLINQSAGAIFKLDYASVSKKSLVNIWNAVKLIYPDFSKAKYEALITDWGKQYGFLREETQPQRAEAASGAEKRPAEAAHSEERSVSAQRAPEPSKGARGSGEDAVIAAFAEMLAPIGKALEDLQGEVGQSRAVGAENVSLKAKAAELESRLSQQETRLADANHSLLSARAENDALKTQIAALESRNAELDGKLNDAYAINSRESSLEAEKIRAELKKAFAFLYEDWLEYEFSDVSEENYESLQAIIKKMFRSLERNGIDFKGNNG